MRAIKQIRLKQYDYQSDGYYFVTAICNWRTNIFAGKEKTVEEQLKDLAEKTEGLSLDYFVVMPNHVHIIFILQNCRLRLGEIVRRFKAKVSHIFKQNYY